MCISALGLKNISNPFSHDIPVTSEDGSTKIYDSRFVLQMIDSACEDLSEPWKIEQLYSRIEASIYGGITENEIRKIVLHSASFYALYDKEFEVVSKKLEKQISPYINSSHIRIDTRKRGFSAVI